MTKSNFRPKIDSGGQKSIFGQKIKSSNFSTKKGPKKSFRGLLSTFGLKLKKKYFRSKIDSGGQKSIFGEKVESVIFQPKLAKKWSLKVSNQFLAEK